MTKNSKNTKPSKTCTCDMCFKNKPDYSLEIPLGMVMCLPCYMEIFETCDSNLIDMCEELECELPVFKDNCCERHYKKIILGKYLCSTCDNELENDVTYCRDCA